MKSEVVILGVNGNCIDIAEAVEAGGGTVRGFLDDNAALHGSTLGRWPVLGGIESASALDEGCRFVCGIGSPKSWKIKPGIIERTGVSEERWTTVIHPTAVVSAFAKVGRGSVILAHASVGARAEVGPHCTLLQGCVVSHDSRLGMACVLATGVCVSGGCEIGDNVYLGCRASVREGIRIGDGSLVGMGSVVVKDVEAEAVVMGNPARRKR